MKNRIKYMLVVNFFYLISFAQDSITIPTVDFALNYGTIEHTIDVVINKNNAIYIENKKIELQDFDNEVYQAIVNKFINKPELIEYLAIQVIADEKVNFSILSPLFEKLKQNGLFKLFLAVKQKTTVSSLDNKIGYLIKLNSFYHPYNNKVIDKVLFSLENDKIVDDVSYLTAPDSITRVKGIDTEKLINNKLINPPKLIEVYSSDKIRVDSIVYNNKILKLKLAEWYNINSITGFVISPEVSCDYQSVINIFDSIYSIVYDKREKTSMKEFNLKFDELSFENQTDIKQRFPIVIVLEK